MATRSGGTAPGRNISSEIAYLARALKAPSLAGAVERLAERARAEATRALAVCTACPVRAECLELSLRTWSGAGQHGIWGGFVEADRNSLRREWLRGAPVTALLPRPAQAR